MTDKELIKAVTDYMHPWTVPVRRNGRLELDLPRWSEVEKAARGLIEGLEKAGYEIRQIADPPHPMGDVSCEDCPPWGYPTDKTRCTPCPRRGHPNARVPTEAAGPKETIGP